MALGSLFSFLWYILSSKTFSCFLVIYITMGYGLEYFWCPSEYCVPCFVCRLGTNLCSWVDGWKGQGDALVYPGVAKFALDLSRQCPLELRVSSGFTASSMHMDRDEWCKESSLLSVFDKRWFGGIPSWSLITPPIITKLPLMTRVGRYAPFSSTPDRRSIPSHASVLHQWPCVRSR